MNADVCRHRSALGLWGLSQLCTNSHAIQGGVYGACIAVRLGFTIPFFRSFQYTLAISDVDRFGRSGLKSPVCA